MARRTERTRLAQVVLLALLGVCVAQTLYWILEQVTQANRDLATLRIAYDQDARAANLLLERGVEPDVVLGLFPHLEGPPGNVVPGTIVVSPAVVLELEDERSSRILRLGSEGTFFLLVLLFGMAILARALARDSELRRRQQNFLAAVTHEFKSPIASLRLSLETMELRDPPADRRAELLDRGLSDLDRLEAMVTNILDTARVEEARGDHNPERVSLDAVVAAELDRLARRAADRGVALEAGDAAAGEVEADGEAVRSVVHNLLDNAVKAAATAGGGAVRVRTWRADSQARLEVVDDGVGFPPDEAERIFEKFHRVGDELRRRDRGTGLGLYLVRELIERDGGRVTGASEGEGRGATFLACWPAAEGTA